MKKTILLAAMLALTVLAMAAPAAMADDRDDRREERLENRLERFFDLDDDDEGFFFFNPFVDFFFDRDDDDFFFDRDFDRDRFDRFDFDGGGEVAQDVDQEAESGEVDQSFEVTGGGDNSNQCVGIQGVANTGNAQNQIGVTQIGSDADDFEFEDSGADIDVSGSSEVTCDQQVNQAASASG